MLSPESGDGLKLVEAMGTELSRRFKQVKEAEIKLLTDIKMRKEGESEQQAADRRTAWLMERY